MLLVVHRIYRNLLRTVRRTIDRQVKIMKSTVHEGRNTRQSARHHVACQVRYYHLARRDSQRSFG